MTSPRPTPLVDEVLRQENNWGAYRGSDGLDGVTPEEAHAAMVSNLFRLARQLERDRAELMQALREAIPNIGRFDFNPVRCPHENTHTFGGGQSGYTINDNQEAGMVRCHTCGHRWQSNKPNELVVELQALLARLG